MIAGRVEVEVEDDAWRAVDDVRAKVERAASAAMSDRPGEIVVLLTGDAEVRAMNAQFRAKDSPTNVLAFPAAGTAGAHLGDVALAYGVCAREAVEQGKSLEHHLSHLVVHGVLHLLGHDHHDEADAADMEARERAVLASLGVADPYREAASDV